MTKRKKQWNTTEALEAVSRAVDPDAQQPDRLEWERRMFRNLAYLSGIQHFSQDPISGRLLPLRDRRGRKRIDFTANLILPTVVKAVAKITGLSGAFTVAPNSGERKDREAAKIGEKFFDFVRLSEDFQDKEDRALLWAANTGLGVLKITWDPDAGDPERVYTMSPEEKEAAGLGGVSGTVASDPGLSPEAQRMKLDRGEYEDIPRGDISIDVVSPYAFYWDADSKDGGLEDCFWAAQKTLVDVDKVYERYGVTVEKGKVMRDTWTSHNTLYEEAISYFHGGQAAIGRTVPGRDRKQNPRVTVVEYFERPAKSNDHEGRYVVVAGDQVVVNKENPYAAIGFPLPFVKFGWIPRPGGFVSIDLTGHLTDPQRAYNESNQHMMDMEKQQGYPILVTWKGSGIKSHRIPNYPGPVLELNPTFGPPIQIPPAPLPQYVYQNVENRRREMQEIASQGDVSRGSTGQVRGSQAISKLLDEDNVILNLVAKGHFNSLARCGRIILALAGRFFDTDRIVKLLGADSHWDVMSFVGADMRGNFDLRVTGEASRIDTSKMRQAVIMELVTAGFLDTKNPADKQLVLDSLYLKLPDQPFEDMLIDKRNAERENEKLIDVAHLLMEAGPDAAPMAMQEMPMVREFEDHRVHIGEHDKLRKGREYQELPQQAQQLIDQHVQGHQKLAAQEMQEQLELELMMTQNGGKPAPKGEASQPKQSKPQSQ